MNLYSYTYLKERSMDDLGRVGWDCVSVTFEGYNWWAVLRMAVSA